MDSAFNVISNLKKITKAKAIYFQKPTEDGELPFSEALYIGEKALNNIDKLLENRISKLNPNYNKLYHLFSDLISLEEVAFQGAFLNQSGIDEKFAKVKFKSHYHRYEEIINKIKTFPENAILVDDNNKALISYFNPENLEKISFITKSICDNQKLNIDKADFLTFFKAFINNFSLKDKEIIFDASNIFGEASLKDYFDIYVESAAFHPVKEAVYSRIKEVKEIKKQFSDFSDVKLNIDGAKCDIKKINKEFFQKIQEMVLNNICEIADEYVAESRSYMQSNTFGITLFDDVIDEFTVAKTQTKKIIESKVKLAKVDQIEETKEKEISNEKVDELIESKFSGIIGLKKVKEELKDMIKLCNKLKKINKFTMAHNHMCFVGKPGTGKTTVARIVSNVLYEAGFLSSNKLTEVSGISLQAEYLGQTAPKVQKIIDQSKGGVLFIDEAYQITDTERDDDSYGKEAIATLIKNMEDKKDLMIIFAGYEKPTRKMIDTNPGLQSRITNTIKFDDYSAEELVEIACVQASEKNFTLEEEAKVKLKDHLIEQKQKPNFSNARCVRNLVELAEKMQTRRAGIDDFILTASDVDVAILKQNELDAEIEKEKSSSVEEEATRKVDKYLVLIKAQEKANQIIIDDERKNRRKHIGFGEASND